MKVSLMKFPLRILTVLLISLCALSASAGDTFKYFESLSVESGFNYSYISPTMLRMMGDSYLSSSSHAYDNLPIQCKDLTSIENISTDWKGQDDELWKIIRQIKKDHNMETLTTKKSGNSRYDVLISLTKDEKRITNLLVVTQKDGVYVNVIYMEGKIPIESIQYSFR